MLSLCSLNTLLGKVLIKGFAKCSIEDISIVTSFLYIISRYFFFECILMMIFLVFQTVSLAHCLSTNLNYIKNFLNQITFFLVLEAIIYSIVGLLSFERQTNHNWMVVTFQFFLRTQTKSDVDGLGHIENESLL